jgi:hypothetical protein
MMKRRGELTHVTALFEKYKQRIKPPQKTVQNVMVEVIFDVTGYTVKDTALFYIVSTRTLTLKIPSILKQEILLHQSEILIHAKGRLGETNAPLRIL